MILCIYNWRNFLAQQDLNVIDASKRTLEKIKFISMKYRLVDFSNSVSELNSRSQSPVTKKSNRFDNFQINSEKADKEFILRNEASMSLFERLKLQHKLKVKTEKVKQAKK